MACEEINFPGVFSFSFSTTLTSRQPQARSWEGGSGMPAAEVEIIFPCFGTEVLEEGDLGWGVAGGQCAEESSVEGTP